MKHSDLSNREIIETIANLIKNGAPFTIATPNFLYASFHHRGGDEDLRAAIFANLSKNDFAACDKVMTDIEVDCFMWGEDEEIPTQ